MVVSGTHTRGGRQESDRYAFWLTPNPGPDWGVAPACPQPRAAGDSRTKKKSGRLGNVRPDQPSAPGSEAEPCYGWYAGPPDGLTVGFRRGAGCGAWGRAGFVPSPWADVSAPSQRPRSLEKGRIVSRRPASRAALRPCPTGWRVVRQTTATVRKTRLMTDGKKGRDPEIAPARALPLRLAPPVSTTAYCTRMMPHTPLALPKLSWLRNR